MYSDDPITKYNLTIKFSTVNNERRKDLQLIIDKLNESVLDIQFDKDAEEEYYDRMPDSLKEREKGTKSQEASEAMQEAIDQIEEAIRSLETAIES